MNGRVVHWLSLNYVNYNPSGKVNLPSDIAPGIYICELRYAEVSKVKKMIIGN